VRDGGLLLRIEALKKVHQSKVPRQAASIPHLRAFAFGGGKQILACLLWRAAVMRLTAKPIRNVENSWKRLKILMAKD
jgi:hypothetical protein